MLRDFISRPAGEAFAALVELVAGRSAATEEALSALPMEELLHLTAGAAIPLRLLRLAQP